MEFIHSIEKTLAEWFKGLPHLPKDISKWLADNAWWLTLAGLIVSGLLILSALSFVMSINAATSGLMAYAYAYSGVSAASVWASFWVSVAFFAVIATVEVMAIKPLKAKQSKGWELLFIAMLLSATSGVVGAIVSYNIGSILGSLIGLAIGLYILFEVREYFAAK